MSRESSGFASRVGRSHPSGCSASDSPVPAAALGLTTGLSHRQAEETRSGGTPQANFIPAAGEQTDKTTT